jgi:hypothetical protein
VHNRTHVIMICDPEQREQQRRAFSAYSSIDNESSMNFHSLMTSWMSCNTCRHCSSAVLFALHKRRHALVASGQFINTRNLSTRAIYQHVQFINTCSDATCGTATSQINRFIPSSPHFTELWSRLGVCTAVRPA